ncbi:MAG: hypothetical protein DRP35_09025 [Candidatus Zixiibacteriota bacterium]|nr:MAG: hypothetical protein DRP35_09025 [candidate division Zixibacteria bacterium]
MKNESKKQGSIYIRDTKVKITDVLDMISNGYLYNSILYKYPNINIQDIMNSAKLAKELIDKIYVEDENIRLYSNIKIIARREKLINLTEIKEKYPRAYEKWKISEEKLLIKLFKAGKSYTEISKILQRQKGAIISRLRKEKLII